jgi:tripartite-type tricarboxylate transporter receptor subunit TctC
MNRVRRWTMAVSIFGVGVSVACGMPAAASYPDHPIRLIIGSGTGGGGDTIARLVAEPLSKALGVAVIPDNRPGASGNIGANVVAKSEPDGYTLLLAFPGHVINPAIINNMPFDTEKDFRAVAKLADNQSVFLVNPTVPAKTMKEFVDLVKKQPAHYSFASLFGSSQHMGGLVLANQQKLKLIFVPYKGNAAAVNDLLGGHVDSMFNTIGISLPLIKAGNVRALAVASSRRSPLLPDVPTMAEAGVPDVVTEGWYALMAPAATPNNVIDILNRAVKKSLEDAKVKRVLAGLGCNVDYVPAKQFDGFIKTELVRWKKVAKDADLKAE